MLPPPSASVTAADFCVMNKKEKMIVWKQMQLFAEQSLQKWKVTKQSRLLNTPYNNKLKNTPLIIAVCAGKIKLVKEILSADANPNLKDSLGRPAIFHACCNCTKNRLTIFKILLKHNAKINITDKYGHNILFTAIESSAFTEKFSKTTLIIINTLIKLGVNINKKGKDGYTILDTAISYGNKNLVKLLLKFGAKATRNTRKHINNELLLNKIFKDVSAKKDIKNLKEINKIINNIS